MGYIKEKIRILAQSNILIDKIWNIVWWIDVKRRFIQYSDLELTKKIWKDKGKIIDFNNPQTLDEKVFYLKLSNRNPLLTICSDKHAVREYVTECGYKHILKKEYGCYNNAEDIDFSMLPSPCYLKCNHASGMNLIYRKESTPHLGYIKWKFNFLLRQNPYFLSREWNYKNIAPKIICEELLEMKNGNDIPELQFFCFNGEPVFGIYNLGLADEKGNHKNSIRWGFWKDYTIIKEAVKLNNSDTLPEKPKNYDEMLLCAQKLSEPFPYVRVDLFNMEGKIIFNELTFYSGGGFTLSKTECIQKLGEKIDISEYSFPSDVKARHKISEIIYAKKNK